MPDNIPVAVIGATGYAGEGAVRILLGHPVFDLALVTSERLAGTRYEEAVPALAGETDLVLADEEVETILASGARFVVLAKKHPDATRLVPALRDAGIRIVDIGAEFRLRDAATYATTYGDRHACPDLVGEAVYGLSEIYPEAIAAAKIVGNPGCYPTSILLALQPLLREGIINTSAHLVATCYSGLSGAGRRFNECNNNLFWAVNENLHSYKALVHQHGAEIDQECSAAAGLRVHLNFVPHLAPITRGIHSTVNLTLAANKGIDDILQCWDRAYRGAPFVTVRDDPQRVQVADVIGTNRCDLGAAVDGEVLICFAAIDNLVKGAAGQAVQNLNLMAGIAETAGLRHRMF